MKIEQIGAPETVMHNPDSSHNYFAWPTATRLQNGKIAVIASGFRLKHVCPFGKTVISYSDDDGRTYTAPAPVFDTPLDDRDGGVMTFGKSGVVITAFNNDRKLQERRIFPAIDLFKSGTRKEELLVKPENLSKIWAIRNALSGQNNLEVAENLIHKVLATKTNQELLDGLRF